MTWLQTIHTKLSEPGQVTKGDQAASHLGDLNAGAWYLYTPEIIRAVQVAYALGRPLLLTGPSGCGKSTIAKNVASRLDCAFLSTAIQSDSSADDLFYYYDHVFRLADAQGKQVQPDSAYLYPGPLWLCYDPEGAAQYGVADRNMDELRQKRKVLLIDEIDKAPSSLPNDLLDAIGCYQFTVKELRKTIRFDEAKLSDMSQKPFIVITSNDERPLPDAFLRRCVHYQFPQVTEERLLEVAQYRLGNTEQQTESYKSLLVACKSVNGEIPQIAEFLDTIMAARSLWPNGAPDTAELSQIINLTTKK